jgi:hypothetical protein
MTKILDWFYPPNPASLQNGVFAHRSFCEGKSLDYALAIRRNRDQLKAIVLALFALARMRVGGSLFTLPRSTFALIMLVLRPAESAVRRLIVIAAETSGTVYSIPRTKPADQDSLLAELSKLSPNFRPRTRAFPLFDPLKRFDPESIWDNEPVWESGVELASDLTYASETPDPALNATRLGQRLNAILRALDNLPRQARRLVRWQAKRDQLLKAQKPTRISPMRPGLPPGWRERKLHEIDDVLRECHGLAHDVLNAPNTS